MKTFLPDILDGQTAQSLDEQWTNELDSIRQQLADLNYKIVKAAKEGYTAEPGSPTYRLHNHYRAINTQMNLLKASINTVSIFVKI